MAGSVLTFGRDGIIAGKRAWPRFGRGGDRSLVRFGFFTDLHYADKDPASNRFYRDAPAKLADAVSLFNSRGVSFVYNNGDLVDGSGSRTATLAALSTVMTTVNTATAPRYHNGGNHDYEQLDLADYAGGTGMDPTGYYFFDVNGIRFITLDACYSADSDSSHYDKSNFTYQDTYVPPTQRAWLTATLASAAGKVVIFCHQILHSQVGASMVKNSDAVRTILEASGKVIGVFAGHAHINDYVKKNGIPYWTMQAAAEGAHPLNAYAVISVRPDFSIEIEGFSQQTTWGIPGNVDTLIARMTVAPNSARQSAIRSLYATIEPLRGKLDYISVPAAHDPQASRCNWLSRGAYDLVPVNSPTFTVDRGWNGDGATSYLTTGFNPVEDGGKFSRDNATMGAFLLTSGTSNASAAGNTNARLGRSTGAMGSRANDATASQTTQPNSFPSHVTFVRDNPSTYKRFVNGVLVETVSVPSTGMTNANFDMCRATGNFATNRVACFYFGAALTDAEVATLHAAILAYMQAVGAAP
jgi:hypothetical protein